MEKMTKVGILQFLAICAATLLTPMEHLARIWVIAEASVVVYAAVSMCHTLREISEHIKRWKK